MFFFIINLIKLMRMKSITRCIALLSLAFATVSATTVTAQENKVKSPILQKLTGGGKPVAFAAPRSAKPLVPVFGADKFRDARYIAPRNESIDPSVTIGPTTSWGVINGPDNSEWLFKQSNTIEGFSSIRTSEITIYNNDYQEVGTFTINIPAERRVNDIQVFGTVTNRFFDLDANTYELTVYLHEIGADYSQIGTIDVYSITDGTLVTSYSASNALYYSTTENFTTYQRYIFVNEELQDDGYYLNASVYAPASYASDTPVLEHTFKIPSDNLQYSDGPYLNYYNIDGEPYFVVSQYEKPYVSDYDENWNPIATEDNNYLITVYDRNFDQVSQLKLPVEQQDGALYTFYTFGFFSYNDLCRGDYTGDDQFNFIVTRYDYTVGNDEDYKYDILVYDESAKLVNTIGSDLTTWMQLSDIEGQPRQYALVHIDEASESIQMVNVPSCETVVTFPGVLNGDLLSTNLDRYPKGDSYQYVIALGNGYDDGNGNTITKIGWYNPDLTLDHFANINLGSNGIFAQHYFVTGSLNPYLFNTDDQHEYILIGTFENAAGSNDNILCIANDNGELKYQFAGDDTKGAYNFGYLSGATTDNPKLLVGFMNDESEFTLDAYNLPFSMFAGGSGQEDDPYIIETPGDLNQMRKSPSAYYALANDLDMSKFYGKFKPVDAFSGGFDGRGNSIDNLVIDGSQSSTGMFGNATECGEIKNVTFNSPVIDVESNSFYAGVVAGMLSGEAAAISNVQVNNALITGDETYSGYIGGLVGQITSNSSVSLCKVNNITINAPEAKGVGGLAGDSRTGTSFTASSASGSITAASNIGGIVGSAGNDVTVTNCHADMTLKGKNTIGGIAGESSRGLISNNYSRGNITATEADRWSGNYNVGGIIGDLETDWSGSTTIVATGNLAAIESVTLPENAEAKAVHRIVGRSIADEEWMEGEEPRTEVGLANNYAVAEMTINGATTTSQDATTVEGADVAGADLSDDFFTGTLGFAYGTTAEEPWKATETAFPILFFENVATDITLDKTTAEMVADDEISLTATVEGSSAERVEFTSSNPAVAQIVSVEAEGNTAVAVIRCMAEGTATITASIDGLNATCQITATSTGIEDVTATRDTGIHVAGGVVTADNAVRIEVFGINGNKVASAGGSRAEVGSLPAGVYVVVATDAAGKRSTVKVVLR